MGHCSYVNKMGHKCGKSCAAGMKHCSSHKHKHSHKAPRHHRKY